MVVFVVWFVDSSISCSSSFDVAMSTTSSTHRRHGALVPLPSISIPSGFFSRSLFISSISTPYSNTDSTPPCRMLSLMWIYLFFPCLVLIFAVMFSLSFCIMFQCLSLIHSLCITYMIASEHALS